MQLPYVKETRKSIQFTETFRGYWHNLRSRVGENGLDDEATFFDMKNMSLDNYPVISTRNGRRHVALEPVLDNDTNHVSAYSVADELLLANGTKLLFGTFEDGFEEITEIENSRKQFAAIGAKILIMPDGLVFNSHDKTITTIKKQIESTTYNLKITPCVMGDDGNYSSVEYVSSDTAPDDQSVYWYDTKNKVLKKYSGVSYSWVGVGTAFLKVVADPYDLDLKAFFDKDINAWDTISFENLICSSTTQQEELDKIARNNREEGAGDNVIYEHGIDYVVIAGFVSEAITVTGYNIQRRMPKLDFITSLNNRIWGCSSENHEIYSCKLGDPTQWFNYPGVASDSYAATIGSLGDFTGATSLNSYALFFKENSMFKVYGDYPANFQVVEIVCEGVERGSELSIQEIGGQLYYKGINGMMVYDGSIPQPFTEVFGGVKYRNAVAGAVQDKYYISMTDSKEYSLFVYDTTSGFWVKEDDFQALSLIRYRNQLLAIDEQESIWIFPEDETRDIRTDGDTDRIEWMVETCNLGLGNPYQKYISRMQLRLDLEGYLKIYIKYNNKEYQQVFSRQTEELRSFTVPLRVKRCDHFRIKMEGKGHVKLYSYGYNLETGSEKQC